MIFLLRLAWQKPDHQPSTSVMAFKNWFREHRHCLRLRKYYYVKYNTLLTTYKNLIKVRCSIWNEQKPEDSESELDWHQSVTGIFMHGQIVEAAWQNRRCPTTRGPGLNNLLYFSDFIKFWMCIPFQLNNFKESLSFYSEQFNLYTSISWDTSHKKCGMIKTNYHSRKLSLT